MSGVNPQIIDPVVEARQVGAWPLGTSWQNRRRHRTPDKSRTPNRVTCRVVPRAEASYNEPVIQPLTPSARAVSRQPIPAVNPADKCRETILSRRFDLDSQAGKNTFESEVG